MKDNILDQLGALAREQELLDAHEVGDRDVPPLTARERDRILRAIVELPPAARKLRPRATSLWISLGGMMAAAMAIVVSLPDAPPPASAPMLTDGELPRLPRFKVDMEGGSRVVRSNVSPMAFEAGHNIRLVVRPPQPVETPLDLSVVGTQAGTSHHLPWRVTPRPDAPGIYVIEGETEDLRRHGSGEWRLQLFVGTGASRRPLPTDPIAVIIVGPREG